MIHKLFEAEKKYPQKTRLIKNGMVLGELYIDHKTRTIKSENGWGVIYDFTTDKWTEIL